MVKKLTNRNGHWSKRIKGKTYYFGKDYKAAVQRYEAEKPYLELGIPVPGDSGSTLVDLLDEFMSASFHKLEAGELSDRTYSDYQGTCDKIAEVLPLRLSIKDLKPAHFDIVRKHLGQGRTGPLSKKSHDRHLGYARTVFRFASVDNRMIDRPLPYTTGLRSVPAKELRKEKMTNPVRLLTAGEINQVLGIASVKFTAMILLAINGGYNNSDIAHLPLSLLVPIPEVLDFPRHKNFIMRQTPLWPETIKAVNSWLDIRPPINKPELFITAKFNAYHGSSRNDQIGKSFYRYLLKLNIYQPGKNFGALRSTFANVIKEVGDDSAARALMGHSDSGQFYESYARGVYLPRLKKCTDHVRKWLALERQDRVTRTE